MIIAKLLAVMIIAYLIGSIPFGLIITRRVAKVDIRQHGSGKIGATNVLRTAGKKAAALVVFLDTFKGGLAVLLAGTLFGVIGKDPGSWWLFRSAQALAALSAMAGHNWSVFLKFQGGRGVATFFGGLVALSPVAALIGGELALTGAILTRFASVGSLAGAVGTYTILVPLTIMNGFPIEYLAYALIGAIAIIISHRDNIARLIAGRERKIGEKAKKIDSSPSAESMG